MPAPFDWSGYLELASELMKNQHNEACQRSAISRVYYAFYCKARNKLSDIGVETPRIDGHQFVWETYSEADDVSTKKIGTTGSRLRRRRVKADYENVYPSKVERDAEIQLKEAEEILKSLDDVTKHKLGSSLGFHGSRTRY